jgi:hypothetical protein
MLDAALVLGRHGLLRGLRNLARNVVGGSVAKPSRRKRLGSGITQNATSRSAVHARHRVGFEQQRGVQ